MATFKIEGGHLLSGTITPQGAKNEALQVICATLLTSEPVTISNVPNIRDVNNLIQLLKDVGVKVSSEKSGTFTFQADRLNMEFLESDKFVEKCSQLRGSVLMIGPLLARMGKAIIAKPGGDKIGRRRLDTHFLGFQKLGAKFHQLAERDVYEIGVLSQVRQISLWPPYSLKVPLRSITLPVNPISSNSATCYARWVQRSTASARTC